MSEDLNLIKIRRKDYGQKTLRSLRIISYISLGFILLSSVFLFLLRFTSEIPALKKQEQTVSSSLSFLTNKVVKFIMVQNRLTEASNVLNQRSDFSKIMETVNKKKPEGFTYEFFSLDKKVLTMTLDSSSLSDLETFLSDLGKEKSFKKITMQNLAFNEESGSYKFSLVINL